MFLKITAHCGRWKCNSRSQKKCYWCKLEACVEFSLKTVSKGCNSFIMPFNTEKRGHEIRCENTLLEPLLSLTLVT